MEMPDMASVLKNVLENPEMLQKAMGMASALASSGALSGILAGMGAPKETEPVHQEVRDPPKVLPAPSRGSPGSKERIALLEAVRPFVSSDRRQNLDQIIRLIGILDLAGSMGLWKSR